MIRRFIAVLATSVATLVAVPAASQAYIHQSAAEAYCRDYNWQSADSALPGNGISGWTLAWNGVASWPVRRGDNDEQVSVVFSGYPARPSLEYTCRMLGTSDYNMYIYTLSAAWK